MAYGKYKERFWTFANVMERLKSIRREEIVVAGVAYRTISQPDNDQSKILQLLNIKL